MESGEASEEKTGSMSAAQKRAEIRRKRLLMNSEDRMNRIVGITKNEPENNGNRSVAASCRTPVPSASRAMVHCLIFSETVSRDWQSLPQLHPGEERLTPARALQ